MNKLSSKSKSNSDIGNYSKEFINSKKKNRLVYGKRNEGNLIIFNDLVDVLRKFPDGATVWMIDLDYDTYRFIRISMDIISNRKCSYRNLNSEYNTISELDFDIAIVSEDDYESDTTEIFIATYDELIETDESDEI